MVSTTLGELAEREFPFLMQHPTNREDAIQVLELVQWESSGHDLVDDAREELKKLAQHLGYRQEGSSWQKAA